MFANARTVFRAQLDEIRAAGTWKEERRIVSPQAVAIQTAGREVLNFCANNYLGLANHPAILAAARKALETRGYGLSSVRFICGTQDRHTDLERALADFVGVDDAILFGSCFDANAGVFEALLGEQDAVISDTLNHASIVDGVRLCRAARYRYAHGDMVDLEAKLHEAATSRLRLIITDGVFSMDGDYAKLDAICDLADAHDALVLVDDSHATGFVGPTGRGTPEKFGVIGRVDLVTSTLGKALGGASGGFVAARQEIVDLLRQRARPYLFSNSLPPAIVGGSLAALDLVARSERPRKTVMANARYFRDSIAAAGFEVRPSDHPIVPIMLGDAQLAVDIARDLLNDHDVYVIGFSYPVVPRGEARIRVQLSAAHTRDQIDRAVSALSATAAKHGVGLATRHGIQSALSM